MSSSLKNRFCRQPWSFVEVHANGNIYTCCPSWVTKPIGNVLEQTWEEIWNGQVAREYRQSMLDSSFCNCIQSNCPHLLSPDLPPGSPVFDKTTLDLVWRKFKVQDTSGPIVVNFCYDSSCNLACPTCRNNLVLHKKGSDDYRKVEKIHRIVVEEIIADAHRLYITGTGDPFASPFFRSFLAEFDRKKYPSIQEIHLHSNANLWTEHTWKGIEKAHPLIKSAEISIDASTPETYSVNRKNGNWDLLLKNLEFINTIKSIEEIVLSFVVQDNNFREIPEFINLAKKLTNIPYVGVHFYKILRWGHLSEEEFEHRAVWKPSHMNYNEFAHIWKKFLVSNIGDPIQVTHNLHSFLET